MTGSHETSSNFEFCRLCNEAKASVVDIFATMVFREGCVLADKLNELYGIEASPNDALSKFICVDCLSQIKSLGNITYCLWSTLDYLIRMHKEQEMSNSHHIDKTAYDLSKESLDFLLLGKKENVSPSLVVMGDDKDNEVPMASCGKSDSRERISDVTDNEQLKVEFCWCSECNEEFLTREELRLHSEKHSKNTSAVDISQSELTSSSEEECKLMSGEVSLVKTPLCCGRCLKEFKNEKGLVKHIQKYDFKCEPRSFINLNTYLNSLKSRMTDDNALWGTVTKDSSDQIKSKLHVSNVLLPSDLPISSCTGNGILTKSAEASSLKDRNLKGWDKAVVGNSANKVKQTKFSQYLLPHVESSSPTAISRKEDLPSETNLVRVTGVLEKGLILPENPGDLSPEVVICDYCNVSYDFKWLLRDHISKCHLSLQHHRCSICYYAFPSESEQKTHEAIHFSKNKYICSLCNGNFSSKAKVQFHVKDSHSNSIGLVCSGCFLCFPSRVELGLHQVCHFSEKKYKCSKCGKAFMCNHWFRSHVRMCQLDEVFNKCKICGKEFLKSSDLNVHILSHDTVKHYPCHLCSKKFTQTGKLQEHIRNVHLKIKPHECGICQRKFAVRQYLLKHYAVHSDDRPFKCQWCGKCFKVKERVTAHIRSVHGNG